MAHDWRRALTTLQKDLPSRKDDDLWPSYDLFSSEAARVLEHLDDDFSQLQDHADFVFRHDTAIHDETVLTAGLFRQWHLAERAPSCAAMCAWTADALLLDLESADIHALLNAGVLAEIENNNAYHSNLHFKKVVFQLIRMVAVHNHIYADTDRAFDQDQILLMLVAACVHDLGHDGLGNTQNGMIVPSRLEQQSVRFAKPWLEPHGISVTELRALLISTDVTPLGSPDTPVNEMKALYRFHYLGGRPVSLSHEVLSPLKYNKDLVLMALMLHEADIATSAGLDYEVTKFESALIRDETTGEQAHPHQVLYFLDEVCQRQMLSDAGQKLFASNLARIYALTEQDVRGGDHAYPRDEHSDFMSSAGHSHSRDSSSKSIN